MEQLKQLLELLRDLGVTEFQDERIHVRFTADPPSLSTDEVLREPDPEPRTVWRSPKLWPGGEPPSFPGKSK